MTFTVDRTDDVLSATACDDAMPNDCSLELVPLVVKIQQSGNKLLIRSCHLRRKFLWSQRCDQDMSVGHAPNPAHLLAVRYNGWGYPSQDLIRPPHFPVLHPLNFLPHHSKERFHQVGGGQTLAQLAGHAQRVQRQEVCAHFVQGSRRLAGQPRHPFPQSSQFFAGITERVERHPFLQPPVRRPVDPLGEIGAEIALLVQPTTLDEDAVAKHLA